MATATTTASNAGHNAKHEAAPWVEKLARAGYAAKGVTYILVGVIAVMAAFGSGDADGSKGVLGGVADGTFGSILVGAVGIGLIGYSLWNFWRAVVDPENEGTDGKGIAKRIFFGVSGVIHASLALFALRAAFSGGGGGGEDGGTQGMVAMALGWPGGQLLVGAVALGIIGFAVYQLIKAYKADLSDMLMWGQMNDKERKTATIAGRLGMTARGVAFALVGFFIALAAWNHNPDEAGGLNKALETLGGFGPWVLGLVAVGLAAYGVYMFVKAKYRRIEAE
jgi:hypothetical protein